MYIPSVFAVSDLPTLHDFIERHSFGLLVSNIDGVPFATHLPFLLKREERSQGVLIGHMARANPHANDLDGTSVLAVFTGPHAYISPTWYEAVNVVPTWNYTAVHAYGRVEVVQDREALLQILKETTATYEAAQPNPWLLEADPTFVDRLLTQIVGFRIEISKLEGKFKLNQNQSAERRERVVRALRDQGGENALGIAELVQGTLHYKC